MASMGYRAWGITPILVNAEGQAPRSKGSVTCSALETGYHLTGDASQAYVDRLQRFRRHLIFVDGRYVVRFDDVEASKQAKLSWLLHTEAKLNAWGNEFTIEGEKAKLYGFTKPAGH